MTTEALRQERDLVGYGDSPPTFTWPDGKVLAVSFVVNYEEGGESCVLNGDAQSEQFLTEVVGIAPVQHDRCPQVESMYEYGSRAGFWRLHRIFVTEDIPVTVFAVAKALEHNPAVVATLRSATQRHGWEVATHGYRWLDYRNASHAQERRDTATAVCVQTALLGAPPVGCYIGRTSPHSARICAELGFLYDSDSYADDYPYYTQPLRASDGDARCMLVVPYTLDVNDMKYVGYNGFTESEQFYRYLCDQLDVLYAEARGGPGGTGPRPLMMSIGLHCRLAGRPARAAGLMRFIRYARQQDGVWFTTRQRIAEYWLQAMPPPQPTFHTTAAGIHDKARAVDTT